MKIFGRLYFQFSMNEIYEVKGTCLRQCIVEILRLLSAKFENDSPIYSSSYNAFIINILIDYKNIRIALYIYAILFNVIL